MEMSMSRTMSQRIETRQTLLLQCSGIRSVAGTARLNNGRTCQKTRWNLSFRNSPSREHKERFQDDWRGIPV